MVLKNPSPILPVNNRNRLTFKQIQTEDYDLAKTQKNILDLSLNVVEALNFSLVAIGSQPHPKSYSISTTVPFPLEFPNTVSDTTKSFLQETDNQGRKVSRFRAPAADNYQASLNIQWIAVVGVTIMSVFLNSNLNGILATVNATVNANATVSLNMTSGVFLDTNEYLYYTVLGNIAGTANLGPYSRILFNRVH